MGADADRQQVAEGILVGLSLLQSAMTADEGLMADLNGVYSQQEKIDSLLLALGASLGLVQALSGRESREQVVVYMREQALRMLEE